MKLPGIGNLRTTLSSKTENAWKELQKNSSVAAKKGQNFILDNMRPLGVSKDARARWNISASQKSVNRDAAPRKNNVDFTKLVSNVWPRKTSGTTSLNNINEKLKNSLNRVKITNSFFQKTSTVSAKDRDALQARANNLLERLNRAKIAIDRSRLDIIENGNRNNNGNRVELDPRLRKAFDEVIATINFSREKIHKAVQANPYQRNSSLTKTKLSENQYYDLKKELDNIEPEIKLKLQITKKVFEEFSKS